MGTNFYWASAVAASDDMSPDIHIGKRSAAGRYCWDCDVTLCVGGKAGIHMGLGQLDACPKCGKPFVPATGWDNPAGVELGFAAPRERRPTGVGGCSSFTWAQDPEGVGARCDADPEMDLIVDEYGRRITGRAFLEMVAANCPVQFTDSIGRWFS